MSIDLIQRAFARVRYQVVYVYDDATEWAANAISEQSRDKLFSQMSQKVGEIDAIDGRTCVRVDVRNVDGVSI